MSWIERDRNLLAGIAGRFDLREPNRLAVSAIVDSIDQGDGREVVCDLATGVGKTWIMVGLIEYLACQGVRNVLIVTPGTTIQDKTLANFTPGSPKFVSGSEFRPVLITAENFARGEVGDALHDSDQLKVFVFNVQQLIKPSVNVSRRVREDDEFIGRDLYGHLADVDDLVVIADEHHVYRSSAKAFSGAVRELAPRALVGLTATPDRSDLDKVIYRYTLGDAIADHYVLVPVIVYREDGHTDEATQLADACALRRVKQAAAELWAEQGGDLVNVVLFVTAQSIEEAELVGELLAGPSYLGDPSAVLVITGQSADDALAALAAVEDPASPVRAVVSVDKLKEGWDVKNIGVIVSRRPLASETLTEQILGRGLRLPYGRRIGVPMLDQVDVVAHDSYRKLLAEKDLLLEKLAPTGLEAGRASGAGSDVGAGGATPAPRIVTPTETITPGHLDLRIGPRVLDADGNEEPSDPTLVLVQEQVVLDERQAALVAIGRTIRPVASAPEFIFPRWELEIAPVRCSLDLVTDEQARSAGAGFAAEIQVPLTRRAIEARRDMEGNVEVSIIAAAQAVATQGELPIDEVAEKLTSRLLAINLVEETLAEVEAGRRVVEAFLAGAGATEGDSLPWGEARAQQASNGIAALVRSAFDARQMLPVRRFVEVRQPVPGGQYPTDVRARLDPNPFVVGQYYYDWRKAMMPVNRFDAGTTEFALAGIFDDSPAVDWWLRLEKHDGAYLELDTTRMATSGPVAHRYYPDFVVIDTDGVRWLVEGKSDGAAIHDDVIAKRRTAEAWCDEVTADGRWGEWRYLFATEAMVQQSQRVWSNLVALSQRLT